MNKSDNGKVLGFWMCTALIIGNVIGMGIFMLPASLAPYGFNAFIGWGVTLIGCVFIAQVFANFARIFPNEDGPYGYTRRVFGNGAVFFVMWCYWGSIWITNATLTIGVVGYLSALFAMFGVQHATITSENIQTPTDCVAEAIANIIFMSRSGE